jgi:hypothetical protein
MTLTPIELETAGVFPGKRYDVPPEIDKLITKIFKKNRFEQNRLANIHNYLKDRVCDIYVPRAATREYRMLVDQSRFNIMPLIVTVLAQNLFVDGYRSGKDMKNAPIWNEIWQPNRMDARQAGIFRAAIKYGYSYAQVSPGDPAPVITPWSPRRCLAQYKRIDDEWPQYVLTIVSDPWVDDEYQFLQNLSVDPYWHDGTEIALFDDSTKWSLERSGGVWVITDIAAHGMGLCPFVKFFDSYGDLDDNSQGQIQPLLPAQRQLNQTTFSLLMAQQYAAFKQRWVTGMTIEEDVNGVAIEPFNSAVNRLFHAESPDTKFGEFGQTDLNGYLNARDKILMFISSVSQIPPNNLMVGTGISNLSAEALASLESGLRRAVGEHQTSFGESTEQMIRLCGKAMGDDSVWEDNSAQVVWRDTTPRSMAQIADALGKLATMLQIPPRELWEKIPGVTEADLVRWNLAADELEATQQLQAEKMMKMQTQAAIATKVAGGGGAAKAPGAKASNGVESASSSE